MKVQSEMSLASFLAQRRVDTSIDDKELVEEEYNAFIDYCNSCDYVVSARDYDLIKSRGLEDSFECLKRIYMNNLWCEFGDVLMNPETEEIESEWHGFPAGTHREVIWEWFEDTFKVSVGEDLMSCEKQMAVRITMKKSLCMSKVMNVTETQLEQLKRGNNPFYRMMEMEADMAKGMVTVDEELYDYTVTDLEGNSIVDWSY